jgi:hypothetical protein
MKISGHFFQSKEIYNMNYINTHGKEILYKVSLQLATLLFWVLWTLAFSRRLQSFRKHSYSSQFHGFSTLSLIHWSLWFWDSTDVYKVFIKKLNSYPLQFHGFFRSFFNPTLLKKEQRIHCWVYSIFWFFGQSDQKSKKSTDIFRQNMDFLYRK